MLQNYSGEKMKKIYTILIIGLVLMSAFVLADNNRCKKNWLNKHKCEPVSPNQPPIPVPQTGIAPLPNPFVPDPFIINPIYGTLN
jgi:hypothetical protein